MGLTIHYSLFAPHIKTMAAARKLLTPLQKFAKSRGFKNVSKLLTWKAGKNDPILATLFSYYIFDENQPPDAPLFVTEPVELIFFCINQPGSEPANFGLAIYQPTAVDMSGENEKPTGLVGWNWRVSCKTQYAANSKEGGWENFYKIHGGICDVLDEARRLGMKVKVLDEGKYWDHRDPEKLKAEIRRWNTMIAAVTGALKDKFGNSISAIQSPITDDPEFERLEADGQHFLDITPEIHVIRAPQRRKEKPPSKPAKKSKPKSKPKSKSKPAPKAKSKPKARSKKNK